MDFRLEYSRLITLLLASRPRFLVASAAPVLVGSALGYLTSGTFSPALCVLALLAIMALHSGANMANDYFDHLSGNDRVNKNPTPFSGGSRYIQKGIYSPRTILIASLIWLTIGSIIGVIIVFFTQSIFILVLGLTGVLGGFFYTAQPVRLGYRCIGELVIAVLFGLLPVYGSYFLQAESIDTIPLIPAVIVAILIFLVILANEFPDLDADAGVNKRTLVVLFGVPACVWIYRIGLLASFFIASAALVIYRTMFFAGLFYLFTLPISIIAIRLVNKQDLTTGGYYPASQMTILEHTTGCLALTVGFLTSAVFEGLS